MPLWIPYCTNISTNNRTNINIHTNNHTTIRKQEMQTPNFWELDLLNRIYFKVCLLIPFPKLTLNPSKNVSLVLI